MVVGRSQGLSAIAAAAMLVSVSGVGAEVRGTGAVEACFHCNEEYHQGGQAWQHFDAYFTFEGDLFQGNFHSQNWSTCINAISVAGHILYGGPEQDADLDQALADGSDAKLLAVLVESPNVEINLQRSAIQIVDDKTAEVVYHAKLTRS